eukprot:CAMPEP_0172467512 /NCGR_PEP_ID=MMETSP1065-20121228/59156_1 /TAXON_ID=265537 /ORGANISM="Amphiprora paludosa, Strain CCMP125" /LENGTH=142 /DNA_ID=CAMNT_0013224675 /DNA_START=53 /DNA_END=477 /DNA_ORIENTATION=-
MAVQNKPADGGGLDLVQVISDDKHYRPFVCCLCVKVVSISHALVSNECSHVYCQSCLTNHVMACQQDNSDDVPCPQCHESLLEQDEDDAMSEEEDDEDDDEQDNDDASTDSRIQARRQRKRRRRQQGRTMMPFSTTGQPSDS